MTATLEDLNGVINWIKEYFDNAGISKAVIGLSGGIDSAVIASICCRALGKKNVTGVVMPCYSQELDSHLAFELTESLNINSQSTLYFDLEKTFDNLWKEYRSNISYNSSCPLPMTYNKLVPANIKARLRMTTLYAVAGHIGGLVVGTTNKTEAMLGYNTKYGDGGVDIEPIQDFYKGEVYELAEMLNDIPQKIIERAPSAGLWDDQTDEGELGMLYSEIDSYLKTKTGKVGIFPVFQFMFDAIKAQKIDKLIAANKHKDLHLPFYKRTE